MEQEDGLARDLTLYLPGLSPLLSFASLSVKPVLLSLFEKYIVVLDSNILKPALKAITLALLPGLEDQTSEEFERTHKLLNRFKDTVSKTQSHDNNDDKDRMWHDVAGSRYFWQSIFLTTMTSSSRRQGALHYLVKNLPRLGISTDALKGIGAPEHFKTNGADLQWPPEIEAITSPEPGLLIRCFAAGLQDEQLLVQRGFLDLLVSHLPLSSPVLQYRVKLEDLELLISAAASVVARREMSLNRRLWSWFIGPEVSKSHADGVPTSPDPSGNPTSEASISNLANTYFESYGLDPLTESVRKMISSKSTASSTRARPFRICLSLMDRSEIGGLVVPRIFIPAMESICQYEKIAPSKEAFSEVLRSAHVFFDGIQSRLIWREIIQLIYSALDVDSLRVSSLSTGAAQQKLDLVWFIITKFNVREEEMLVVHMPMACLVTLICIQNVQRNTEASSRKHANELITIALKIATRLLEFIPERAFIDSAAEGTPRDIASDERPTRPFRQDIERVLQTYQRSISETRLAFSRDESASILVQNAADTLVLSLESPEQRQNLEPILSIVAKAVQKSPNEASLDTDIILSKILENTRSCVEAPDHTAAFSFAASLLSTFEFMSHVIPSNIWASDHRIRGIATNLIMSFWASLSPAEPQHSVEAVRSFWRLHSISPDAQLVESTIASLMISQTNPISGDSVTLEGFRRFATLWTHSGSKLQAASDRRSSSGRTKKQSESKSLADSSDPDMLARPLLLLLDSLCDESTALSMFTASWLQSLPSIQM